MKGKNYNQPGHSPSIIYITGSTRFLSIMIFNGTMKKIFYPREPGKLPFFRSFLRSPGQAGFRMIMIALVAMLSILTACVSDIEIKVPETKDTYIIEGWIERGGFAHVLVSHSLPYNSTIGLADLFDLLVTDAQVTVKSDTGDEKLLLVQDTMYTILPVYRGYLIRGEPGKAYTLEVKIGDRVFTSTDTMLEPVGPDSLWFSAEPLNDSLGYIHMRLRDPPEPGNYYRILAKRLGIDIDYTSLSGNLLDDHLFNGKAINFPLIRFGPLAETPDKHFFRRGQRVVVKTGVITRRYFDFLSKVSNEMGKTLSPLSFQVPTITLMAGGALGGWGCYAITLDTVDIK